MALNPVIDATSIFKDGKLNPGIYTIQNLYTETFLDFEVHSREVCCRPAGDLGEGRGVWEIKQLGSGYTVQRFDPGNPEQFCIPLNGLNDGVTLCVAPYPVAWRVEIVEDEARYGFEYVRFYWPNKKIAWDLAAGRNDNGAKVVTFRDSSTPWQMWWLAPVRVQGVFTPPHSLHGATERGSLPAYERATGHPSTRAQHVEPERENFCTLVTEGTTVTTRKR